MSTLLDVYRRHLHQRIKENKLIQVPTQLTNLLKVTETSVYGNGKDNSCKFFASCFSRFENIYLFLFLTIWEKILIKVFNPKTITKFTSKDWLNPR